MRSFDAVVVFSLLFFCLFGSFSATPLWRPLPLARALMLVCAFVIIHRTIYAGALHHSHVCKTTARARCFSIDARSAAAATFCFWRRAARHEQSRLHTQPTRALNSILLQETQRCRGETPTKRQPQRKHRRAHTHRARATTDTAHTLRPGARAIDTDVHSVLNAPHLVCNASGVRRQGGARPRQQMKSIAPSARLAFAKRSSQMKATTAS